MRGYRAPTTAHSCTRRKHIAAPNAFLLVRYILSASISIYCCSLCPSLRAKANGRESVGVVAFGLRSTATSPSARQLVCVEGWGGKQEKVMPGVMNEKSDTVDALLSGSFLPR